MQAIKSKYQSLIIIMGVVVALVISLSAYAGSESLLSKADGDGKGNGLSAKQNVLNELKSIIKVPAFVYQAKGDIADNG